MLNILKPGPRKGVHKLTRWPNASTSSPIVTDAIHLSSCVMDVLYTSGLRGIGSGQVDDWQDLAVPSRHWTATSFYPLIDTGASPGVHKGPDNAKFVIVDTPITLTGTLTLYWLADYNGTSAVVVGSSDKAAYFSISKTTAKIQSDTGVSQTKDGTLYGNRLYRWRRKADNTCFFKPGDGTEVAMGSVTGDITIASIFYEDDTPAYDNDANRTRRILLYNADLPTTGQSTAIEALITDIMTEQVTVTYTATGTFVPGDSADMTMPITFEAYGEGGAGEDAKAGGGNGGGGGGYGSITLPGSNTISLTKSSSWGITIASGTVSIIDPDTTTTLCAGAIGSAGGVLGNAGGVGAAGGKAGYVSLISGNGGRGGDQGFGGGGGGGGSGGRAGNGVAGSSSTSNVGGAGGSVNFAGGKGGSVGIDVGANGTTPSGGGGGDPSDGATGGAGGAARAYVTYYINTTKDVGGHNITTIKDSGGGQVQVLTAAPHGLSTATVVTISGNSQVAYNGVSEVDVKSPTSFNVEFAYVGDGTGGRWD